MYSVLWATVGILYSHPSGLRTGCSAHVLFMGVGREGCNSKQMQFSASRSSLDLQEFHHFHHHGAQGHKPSQDLPDPTQELHTVLAILKKRWETNRAKGVELMVSGHKDTSLSWVSAALTGKALAYLLLCFNSSDHCQTMCESTNLYCTLKEQASSSVLQCKSI